ncbi:hypothetical protein GIB67_031128 [Kingdonia uniflora]|uniref:Serine-threonine/tyrosine-protein kinase catalytic domain-containing protein n=1 Tax=Kingdonia uniflora TaxID=39325 RepID=A0A7J7MEJ3_9MAGN|nr:hypothetical protein GIB67_031128 [Kingdonia uniflora]
MFDQVNATFHKGMVEHTAAAQRQFESSSSQLVLALKDTINSTSSMTQILTRELADGQRKLLALAVAKENSNEVNPLVKQLSNGPLASLHDMVYSDFPTDFGLAKLCSRDSSHMIMTECKRTLGYAALELWMPYPMIHKYDVYSFEILLFESLEGEDTMMIV